MAQQDIYMLKLKTRFFVNDVIKKSDTTSHNMKNKMNSVSFLKYKNGYGVTRGFVDGVPRTEWTYGVRETVYEDLDTVYKTLSLYTIDK